MLTENRIAWTLNDAAKATGLSVAFFKKVIKNGEIAATKAGARTLILDEDLRAWLNKDRKIRSR
jgi:excisionase family DNA binding protein